MLEANFLPGVREASVFGLTQWDKGQQIAVSFENMPDSFQVHFSSRGSEEAVVVDAETINGKAVVDIPDEMLTNDSDIIAWIYLKGEDTGETIGKATLYVRKRPRPKGYIEELVPSQQQLVEKMITDLKNKLDNVLENGSGNDFVPEYVEKESYELAKKVLACQNENTVSFLLATDFHYDLSDYYTQKGIEHMAQAMKLIRSVCKIDFAASLGGYIADKSDKSISDAEDEILSVSKALHEGFADLPQMRAIGPDDMLSAAYYRNADYLDCSELYPMIGKLCKGAVFNPDDPYGGYCYIDIESAKLRVICLNTSDFKKTQVVKPETNKAKMSSEQLIWLCSALNLSSKENYTEWATLVVSHFPVNYYDNFTALKNIVKAYNTGGTVEMLDSEGKEISYSFSGVKSSAPLLAFFNGALHNFKVNTIETTKIPMITIPNACFGDNNYFSDEKYSAEETLLFAEDATWEKTASSENETAFCVATLDKSEGKLFIHCYGAGYDREIEFEGVAEAPPTPDIGPGDDVDPDDNTGGGTTGGDSSGDSDGTYTNLVGTSTDEFGDIYNRVGYTDGNCLDETGSENSLEGYTVTGYIEAENGDVVRIKGGNWSQADGNILAAYDADFCFLWSAPLSGSAVSASGISYNSDVAVFESLKVSSGSLSDMAYIRVSCSGNGENLIVTRNEEIPTSGSDSEVTPPVVEYVNIIPFATDEFGDVYNRGTGYMDGYALSDDGCVNENEPKPAFTHTGYLYAEKGSVIRLKGYNWTSDEGNYFIVYDSDYMQLFTVEINSETNKATYGISFSGGIMKFDSSAVTAEDIPDSFNIRISTKASGANLVATYNEELA